MPILLVTAVLRGANCAVPDGLEVLKRYPARDGLGRVTVPAQCWLSSGEGLGSPPEPGIPVLTVSRERLGRLAPTDTVTFRDARGRARHLEILWSSAGGALAALERSAYVAVVRQEARGCRGSAVSTG